MPAARALPTSIDDTLAPLGPAGHLGDRAPATVPFPGLRPHRPVPGVLAKHQDGTARMTAAPTEAIIDDVRAKNLSA